MNKLVTLVSNGDITVEELASAEELIERADWVISGINACKQTLIFPIGVREINCYSFTHSDKGYKVWGNCTCDGMFTCFSNQGGNHVIGSCNLTNPIEVFMAFENSEFKDELRMFLLRQIMQQGDFSVKQVEVY